MTLVSNWKADFSGHGARSSASVASIRSILIMKWSAMGDVALASAAMQDICTAFPSAEIDLDTSPRFAGLFKFDPRFRNVLGIDTRARAGLGLMQWLRVVGKAHYDLIVDFQSTDRSRLLLSLLYLLGSAPAYRIGNHRRWPYNIAPSAQDKHVHALEHLRATLSACTIVPSCEHPVLHFGPEHEIKVAGLLEQHQIADKPYALFMPGCQKAGQLKRWGWRRYAELASAMNARGINKILIVGAQDERDECDAIAAACPAIAINLCGKTSVLDLIPLANKARCVVANDTGTAHVASSSSRPMLVVCGPTDPQRVKPAGNQVVTLQADLWCKNCYRKECSHHSCMSVLSPYSALQELDKLGVFNT